MVECTLTFCNVHTFDEIANVFFFFVSLTVHLGITLANDQLDAQIFNTFITVLYMYTPFNKNQAA